MSTDSSPAATISASSSSTSPTRRCSTATSRRWWAGTRPSRTAARWWQRTARSWTYLHLSDNLGDVDNELALGTGIVDWVELTRVVDRYGDEPLAVIETSTMEDIRASHDFLETERIYPFAGS